MKRWLIILAPLLTLFLASRAVFVHQYSYLSFEGIEGAAVTMYGDSKVADIFDRTMPMAYRIERPSYTILLMVDGDNLNPNILVSGAWQDGTPLLIRGIPAGPCGNFMQSGYVDRLELQWYRPWTDEVSDCSGQNLPMEQSLLILHIRSSHDDPVEERLPFEIRKNGYRLEIDAP